MPHRSAGRRPTGLASVGVGRLAWLVKAGKKIAHPADRSLMIGHIFRIGSKIKHTQGRRTHRGFNRPQLPRLWMEYKAKPSPLKCLGFLLTIQIFRPSYGPVHVG